MAMTRSMVQFLLPLALASSMATVAHAVNLLSNSGFSTDTSSWTVEDPSSASLAFSPLDADSSPTSGSALVRNVSAGPSNGSGISQCVNTVAAGRTYRFLGKVLFPPGQARTGFAALGLRWWTGANCTGDTLSQPRLNQNTPNANWVLLTSTPQVAPPGTVSAEFVAFPSKVEPGGELVGQFDDLQLVDELIEANFQGIWWAYPAGSESGWGLNVSDDASVLYVTWFTYGADGSATWFVVAMTMVAPFEYAGTLYTATGPPFDAVPWNPAGVAGTAVGTATLKFSDFNRGIFAYTIGNLSQQKEITREVFAAPVPTCVWNRPPNFVAATNYQGMWWAAPPASEDGWGINLNHQDNIIFATWFTYRADGKPTWFVVAASQTGPDIYSGKLFTATGSPYFTQPWDSQDLAPIEVGTATFTFANGNSATFDYTVNDVTRSKPITREIFNAPGTECS
jgi:hypothetical protein